MGYEVEAILGRRRNAEDQTIEYLIKWKNYPPSDNQWIKAKDCNCPDEIEYFLKNRK